MQLAASNKSTLTKYVAEIPDLVWVTGPVSYDYHFADRELFDGLILASWQLKGFPPSLRACTNTSTTSPS